MEKKNRERPKWPTMIDRNASFWHQPQGYLQRGLGISKFQAGSASSIVTLATEQRNVCPSPYLLLGPCPNCGKTGHWGINCPSLLNQGRSGCQYKKIFLVFWAWYMNIDIALGHWPPTETINITMEDLRVTVLVWGNLCHFSINTGGNRFTVPVHSYKTYCSPIPQPRTTSLFFFSPLDHLVTHSFLIKPSCLDP